MHAPAPERSREPPDDGPTDWRPKATLFCQQCGREDAVDGDWEERERAGRMHVHCPDCDNRLTSLAGPDGRLPRSPRGDGSRLFEPLLDTWMGAGAVWRASVRSLTHWVPNGRSDA